MHGCLLAIKPCSLEPIRSRLLPARHGSAHSPGLLLLFRTWPCGHMTVHVTPGWLPRGSAHV
jgi:hypothetical protein